MKIEFKNGKVLEFEDFEPEEKNLRKININISGKDGEGVWAYLSNVSIEKYDSDYSSLDYEDVAIMANNAIMFYPQCSCGLYFPIIYNNASRPTCDFSKLDGKMIFR